MNKYNKNSELLRFIKLYKSHAILWDMNLPSYRRNDIKIKAYESISTEMDMSVEDVKKKIKSLRTAYSAERTKVEKSKKSGRGADFIYTPTLFWYNEMAFLSSSLIRRTTVDNSNREKKENFALIETSLGSATNELSLSESLLLEQTVVETPTSSKRIKHSTKAKSKLDDALDKLIEFKKCTGVFETFGESVARQIKEFPEEEAYQLMADIQVLLSKRKKEVLRKVREEKLEKKMLKRPSTPLIQSSSSNTSSEALSTAMPDAAIVEEDCILP